MGNVASPKAYFDNVGGLFARLHSIERHLTTPDGNYSFNSLSGGYRRFFTDVRPYLDLVEQIIDDGLPIPFVMDSVTARDG